MLMKYYMKQQFNQQKNIVIVHIDNVLINEKFKMDETKKIFKGKDEITYDDILRLYER